MKLRWILPSLILLATTWFQGISAHASPVNNESHAVTVALFTPWSYFEKSFQNYLSKYTINEIQTLPDQTWNASSLDWHFSGIQWRLQSAFSPGAVTPQELEVQTRNLKVSILVQQISVDQIIEKEINGITLRVHVQAQCGPMTLTQNLAQGGAQIQYQFSPQKITTQVGKFNLQWPASSWAISAFECRGPNGLDQAFKDGLSEKLKTAEDVKPLLVKELSSRIQAAADSLVTFLKTPTPIQASGDQLPLTLTFQKFQSSEFGLLLYGEISWVEKNSGSENFPLPLSEVPSEVQDSATPVLLTATESWNRIIEAEFRAQKQQTRIDLSSYDFFKKLMKSRLLQLFTWPDLWSYPKASPFSLALGIPQITDLKWQVDGSVDLQLKTTGWVQSLRDGKSQNYIQLQAQGTANLLPKISNGQLNLAVQGKDSSVDAQFGIGYVNEFHPNTYLSKSLKQNLAKGLESNVSFSNTLPSLSFGQFGKGLFDGWQPVSGGLIVIPLKIIQN